MSHSAVVRADPFTLAVLSANQKVAPQKPGKFGLGDEEGSVRWAAVQTLAGVVAEPAVRAALLAPLGDAAGSVREAAVVGYGEEVSMRGGEVRSGSLFSYVDVQTRVPRSHPLRMIRALVNAALARLDGDLAYSFHISRGLGR